MFWNLGALGFTVRVQECECTTFIKLFYTTYRVFQCFIRYSLIDSLWYFLWGSVLLWPSRQETTFVFLSSILSGILSVETFSVLAQQTIDNLCVALIDSLWYSPWGNVSCCGPTDNRQPLCCSHGFSLVFSLGQRFLILPNRRQITFLFLSSILSGIPFPQSFKSCLSGKLSEDSTCVKVENVPTFLFTLRSVLNRVQIILMLIWNKLHRSGGIKEN